MEAIDPELKLFSCMICGRTCGEYELKMIYRDHDVHPLFKLARQMKNLGLTGEEMAVVIPYTFFSACNIEKLRQPEVVERHRQQINEVLHFVIANSRGKEADTFLDELFGTLAELRKVSIR